MGYSADQRDRLIKALYPYLAARLPARDVMKLGYFRFANLDRPETNDVVSIAAEAFLYLSLDSADSWNSNVDVLISIVAFLKDQTDRNPSKIQGARLKTLLQDKPVNTDEIRGWFDQVYR